MSYTSGTMLNNTEYSNSNIDYNDVYFVPEHYLNYWFRYLAYYSDRTVFEVYNAIKYSFLTFLTLPKGFEDEELIKSKLQKQAEISQEYMMKKQERFPINEFLLSLYTYTVKKKETKIENNTNSTTPEPDTQESNNQEITLDDLWFSNFYEILQALIIVSFSFYLISLVA